jgi:alginate O-acetyltransferase complex protein AlgI
MQFNTPIFLFLFLPVFLLAYYLADQRGRLLVGIAGSLLFYAWGSLPYVALLVGVTAVTYSLGLVLQQREHRTRNRVVLWASAAAAVGILLAFKLVIKAAYPLGLSYILFQALSYVLEIHGGRIEAERDPLRFAFYLMLFPKIPVGPIVRYSSVREQVGELKPQPEDMAAGLRRFIRGLAKKVLIADTLARVVDPIFKLSAPLIPPAWAWLVLVSFALQLFFDFAGYSDMAIGLGRMLGLTFLENFNFPYLSTSISDFWRRWHISLSIWFRDFVFYPLERRRLRWIGQPLNTLIVFVLVGLWHGIGLTFVLWGLLHGLALVFETTPLGRRLTRQWVPLSRLYALGTILAGWVFFRAPTVQFAVSFFHRLMGYTGGIIRLPFGSTMPLPFIEPTFVMALVAGLILCFPVGRWLDALVRRVTDRAFGLRISSQVLYDVAMLVLMIASLAAMASSTFTPGIYAKF